MLLLLGAPWLHAIISYFSLVGYCCFLVLSTWMLAYTPISPRIVCCHVFPLGGVALHSRLVWNHREEMLHSEHGAVGATGGKEVGG